MLRNKRTPDNERHCERWKILWMLFVFAPCSYMRVKVSSPKLQASNLVMGKFRDRDWMSYTIQLVQHPQFPPISSLLFCVSDGFMKAWLAL